MRHRRPRLPNLLATRLPEPAWLPGALRVAECIALVAWSVGTGALALLFAGIGRSSVMLSGGAGTYFWAFEWFLGAFSLMIAAVAWWKIRRLWVAHVRKTRGLCRACGYDLRATIDRCPECGTAVGAADETQANVHGKWRSRNAD